MNDKGALPERLDAIVPVEILKSEVAAWANKMEIELKSVSIRPMKRKWASCSSEGRLTFDTGLLRMPGSFRREVIVHELLHLKLPNHGKLFKLLHRAYLKSNG